MQDIILLLFLMWSCVSFFSSVLFNCFTYCSFYARDILCCDAISCTIFKDIWPFLSAHKKGTCISTINFNEPITSYFFATLKTIIKFNSLYFFFLRFLFLLHLCCCCFFYAASCILSWNKRRKLKYWKKDI